jgi:5-methyltetrahydrofolate--homocysteine methyltransferase
MSEKSDTNVKAAIMQLKEEQVLGWVQDQLERKAPPHEIMDELSAGLKKLGDRFASGTCFIPELIRGGEIFLKALELVRPAIEAEKSEIKKIGTFLIATVQGDLHDLGKNLTAITLMTAGFEVIDLGKDVTTDRIVAEVGRIKPNILGLSALLTTTTEQQQAVVRALEQANLRDNVKIIVGGAPVNQKWADHIGADAFGADAIDGLRKSKALLGLE